MARTPGDAVSFMGIPLENAAPSNGEAYVYNSSTLQRELSSIGNETITLSGDVTGSGATSITTTIENGAVDIAMLSATGTPSSSTYLRGDNTRATISGGGDFFKDGSVAMTGDLDLGGNSIVDLADVTFRTGASGGTLRTGTSAADKFTLQAYDTNAPGYVTVLEVDAGTTVRGQLIADYRDFEDATDQTKIMNLDLSGITTGTTRTITMADQAIDLTPDTGTYQSADAGLTSIAGLTTAADKMIYTTASDTYAVADLTSAGRALLDDADASAQRTTLGLGTSDSPQFNTIELGHATDTTVSRVSAGVIAVEGVTVPTISSTNTLTNKTIALGSNTVSGTKEQFDTACSDDNFAYVGTANTFTENQTFNKEIIIDSTLGTDHEASGPTTSVTAGASVSQFDVCQLQSDGKFDPADSSTASSANANGMLALSLEEKTDTQAMKVALPGCFVRDDTWTWTVGGVIYLGTSGAMTQTAPTTSGHTVRVLGYAISADVIYRNPSPDFIELS